MKYRLEVKWNDKTYEQTFNNSFYVEERLIELCRLKFITKESFDKLYKFLQEFNTEPSNYGIVRAGTKGNIILEITEDIEKNKTIDELIKCL